MSPPFAASVRSHFYSNLTQLARCLLHIRPCFTGFPCNSLLSLFYGGAGLTGPAAQWTAKLNCLTGQIIEQNRSISESSGTNPKSRAKTGHYGVTFSFQLQGGQKRRSSTLLIFTYFAFCRILFS